MDKVIISMSNLNSALRSKILEFNIPTVDSHSSISNPVEFVDQTRKLQNIEGFVIAWDSGYRVKIKADEYLLFHKTKVRLTMEKNVVAMLVNEKVDDLKAFMLTEDRVRLERFETAFWDGLHETVDYYERYFAERVLARNLDRKRFALEVLPQVKKCDPFIGDMVFGQFNGKNVRDMVLDTVRKNLNTQTKVDSVRQLWKNTRWSYHFNGDV